MPASLIVLGGGVVGVEMAQAWASLGSEVTLIEALDRLLAREEPSAGRFVRQALEQLGVRVHAGLRAERVDARRRDGASSVHLDGGQTIRAERLLVAVGRKPHTDDLGLETVGLPAGEELEVDGQMRVVAASGLYAIGDVNGRALLTHAGKYQARIAADHILGLNATAWADTPGAPRVVFTEPQVGAVGLTLDAARKAGLDAVAIDLQTSGTAGASFHGRGAPGETRFVVDPDRELLVGATFIGPDVAEFLQAATIAIVGEVPLRRLAHAIAPFPTRSEIWLKFVEAYESTGQRACTRTR